MHDDMLVRGTRSSNPRRVSRRGNQVLNRVLITILMKSRIMTTRHGRLIGLKGYTPNNWSYFGKAGYTIRT